jgi:hypothetical protein
VATWLGQKCEIGGGHDLFEMGIISEERRVEGEISIGCVRSYSNVGITGAEVNGLRSGDDDRTRVWCQRRQCVE